MISLEIASAGANWSSWGILMFLIEKTTEFNRWLRKLKDLKAKAKILFRIQKIENEGHFGGCK